MYILGINYGIHNSSASLIKDGNIIAAVEEERLNRTKNFPGFPKMAISHCLEKARIGINDINIVGFNVKPPFGIPQKIYYFLNHLPKSLKIIKSRKIKTGGFKTAINYLNLKKQLYSEFGFIKTVFFVPHHIAHASSAYFVSPFNKSAILTMDFIGEWETTTLSVANGNNISTILKLKYPDSLGLLYSAITQYLGFRPENDEYKVMGLSSYGEPSYYDVFKDVIQIGSDGIYRINRKYFQPYLWNDVWFSKKLVSALGPPRKQSENPTMKRFTDVACSLQKRLEDVVLSLCSYVYKKTGMKNLCLSGGVALNSVMNGKIKLHSDFANIFVPPAPHDAGGALGSALYIYYILGKNKRHEFGKVFNPFLGPDYKNRFIIQTVREYNLNFEIIKNPAQKGAELIVEGKVLGWFQGNLEWGQRALGNRSILADPRVKEMQNIINRKIKYREPFRPFAPSILEEYVNYYFEEPISSPYMLTVAKIKKEMRDKIPAVTHVDGTGRLQTVTKGINNLYWQLINEFRKITGIPMVLNTSFNIKDEPIVCSPYDAINCFLKTDIDVLIMDNVLLRK